MKKELELAIPMAQAFARLLHPFAEVVIHDIAKDTIEAIYNPYSKRQVGDSSYLDRWDFTVNPQDNVIGPYEKTNYDGRKLKSISVVLRNANGKAVGFLCVNMDVSVFERYQNSLDVFLKNNDQQILEKKQGLFKDDIYEQINAFVQQYCMERQLSLESLSREENQQLVQALKTLGAFKGKNATNYIARILNVSRATVYNYLKDLEDNL
ncbi:MAG: PAS domain-containing protein [Proteobacteria bacterium]|nr:PAS domain-containing protein [Pseudomonadota bacterium]